MAGVTDPGFGGNGGAALAVVSSASEYGGNSAMANATGGAGGDAFGPGGLGGAGGVARAATSGWRMRRFTTATKTILRCSNPLRRAMVACPSVGLPGRAAALSRSWTNRPLLWAGPWALPLRVAMAGMCLTVWPGRRDRPRLRSGSPGWKAPLPAPRAAMWSAVWATGQMAARPPPAGDLATILEAEMDI